MTSNPRRYFLTEQDEELRLLWLVLGNRGWRMSRVDDTTWTWPVDRDPDQCDSLTAGATIYFDEEDPDEGYCVEGPHLGEDWSRLLQYPTIEELVAALDRIESWRYGQSAADVDPDHLHPVQAVGSGLESLADPD